MILKTIVSSQDCSVRVPLSSRLQVEHRRKRPLPLVRVEATMDFVKRIHISQPFGHHFGLRFLIPSSEKKRGRKSVWLRHCEKMKLTSIVQSETFRFFGQNGIKKKYR